MIDLFEFTILTEFLPAIIYDDWSGLSSADEETLRAWIEKQHAHITKLNGSFERYEYVTCQNFAHCEITHLMGDVSDLLIIFKTYEETAA